mmetsp:Transcript_9777/g.25656  ORF Transcript_9777/g.25656 Transcript_9777/m.25656 type:complete len:322 (+) Transcript_9777:68-1033(+)
MMAGAPTLEEGGPIRGHFLAFHCNFMSASGEPCRQRITQEGWLTGCVHLLCVEHAREWFSSNVDCPVCKDGRAVRVLKLDFCSIRKEAKLRVIGFSPRQVLEAAMEAIEFWASQKALEVGWQTDVDAKLALRHRRLHDVYNDKSAEAVAATRALQGRCADARTRLQETLLQRDRLMTMLEQTKARLLRIRRSCAAVQRAEGPASESGVLIKRRRLCEDLRVGCSDAASSDAGLYAAASHDDSRRNPLRRDVAEGQPDSSRHDPGGLWSARLDASSSDAVDSSSTLRLFGAPGRHDKLGIQGLTSAVGAGMSRRMGNRRLLL